MNTKSRINDQINRPEWLSTTQWPFTLRRHAHRNVSGEQIDIHYTDEGSGPTLVFVHAGMWSFIWRDAIAALRSDFRCISLDFPGTGLSGGESNDIDIETFPQILEEVLDECHVDEASFVVHDLGGVVGVLAAALRPQRATGLVVTNSFSWAPDRVALRAMLRLMGSHPITASLGSLRVLPRLSSTTFGVGRHFDAGDRTAFLGPYRSRSKARNFHRTMRSAREAKHAFEHAEEALTGSLSHLPVLTIFGEKNDPFGFADRWKTLFPQAGQWTVKGGNHFPMCDDPDGFVEHVAKWHSVDVGRSSRHEASPVSMG